MVNIIWLSNSRSSLSFSSKSIYMTVQGYSRAYIFIIMFTISRKLSIHCDSTYLQFISSSAYHSLLPSSEWSVHWSSPEDLHQLFWNGSFDWHEVDNSACIHDDIQMLVRCQFFWLLFHLDDQTSISEKPRASACFTALIKSGSGEDYINFHSYGSLNLWWILNKKKWKEKKRIVLKKSGVFK